MNKQYHILKYKTFSWH